MSLLSVSIIIPCRNEVKFIERNLLSVIGQDYEGFCEAIVVDGMSDDGTAELTMKISQQHPGKIKLIQNPNQFTPHALNLGIHNSSSEVFIILGGHAYLDQSFVRKNVEALMSDLTIGCAGGVIKNIHETSEGAVISKAMASAFGVGNATFRLGGKRSFVDTVAFGAYRREVFEKIGGFDEVLVRNQDDDYNFRVIQAGYKILFDPEIVSHYFVRSSLQKLWKQYFQYGYWKVYVNKKHKQVTTIRQVFPALFVMGICVGSLLGLIHWIFPLITGAVICLYLITGVLVSFRLAPKPADAWLLLRTFITLHFAYGFGYLKGIIQFLILNKQPGNRSKELSR